MNTGLSGTAALISSSVGRRFSSNCHSFQPPTTFTHWPSGVRAACSFSISSARLREVTPSQRSSML